MSHHLHTEGQSAKRARNPAALERLPGLQNASTPGSSLPHQPEPVKPANNLELVPTIRRSAVGRMSLVPGTKNVHAPALAGVLHRGRNLQVPWPQTALMRLSLQGKVRPTALAVHYGVRVER